MPQHHNPLDPRDPYFAPFYFTFIADDGKGGGPQRGGNGGRGCGCFIICALIVLFLLIVLNSH